MKQTVFTICSANYLPTVKVLMDSLSRHEGATRRVLVLAERDYDSDEADALGRLLDCEVLPCSRLSLPQAEQMAFQYDITEFNTAIKPFVFQHLFDQGDDAVIYLDPDICLYAPLAALWEQLASHAAIVTPHITEPLPDDGLSPSNENMARCGQFNFGFVGFDCSAVARRFIDWWAGRLAEHCIFHPHHYYFVDQFYGALVASHVPDLKVWHHQGYNYAYWNAPQRTLTRDDDGHWLTADGPLVFFHFSGFTREDPAALSRHQNRFRAAPDSAIAELAHAYAQAVADNAAPVAAFLRPYSYGSYADGTPIDALERRAYRDLPQDEKQRLAPPFDPALREQLGLYAELSDVGGSATGMLWQLWQQRQALQEAVRATEAVRQECEAVRQAAQQEGQALRQAHEAVQADLRKTIEETQGYLDAIVGSRGYQWMRWLTEPMRWLRGQRGSGR